jgi:hypothetical protein
MRFSGRLQLREEPGPGLAVTLELDDRQLTVTDDFEILGSSHLADVIAEPLTRDPRRALALAGPVWAKCATLQLGEHRSRFEGLADQLGNGRRREA